MYLSKETTIRVSETQANIIGHLGYSASKLWNVCNYERKNYDASSGEPYPNWYYQKKFHKDNVWFKSLPSQTAQEVCKLVDKAWKSFFALKKTKGIQDPKPPRFKQVPMPVTYMQNGIKRKSSDVLRLTLPKGLKDHMAEKYGIHENYLILENGIFKDMDNIKQLKIYMPEDETVRLIVIYEVADAEARNDNGHYLSIDLGIHNFMTCFDSEGYSFIIGRKYLSIVRRYDKEIARVQSQWAAQQSKKGVRYPKSSNHKRRLHIKKNNTVRDYLHKVTRCITDYCETHGINTVIIGDLTGVRENKNFGDRINQEFHSLPFRKATDMLSYKLKLRGINIVSIKEAYSSQCSPLSVSVDKQHASKKNRVRRGLYSDNGVVWNADSVGAYNIMRLYLQENDIHDIPAPSGLSCPEIIKVAV